MRQETLIPSTTNWVGSGITDSTNTPAIAQTNLESADSAVFSAVVDVTTPAAKASAAASWAITDIITTAAHSFVTGLKGQVTSDGTKPTGISLSTDYFVRVLSSTTFNLYDTLAHAVALGSTTGLVDITNIGSGNHTFTPSTYAGGQLKLQGSFDETNFVDIPDQTRTVTADATEVWEIDYIRYKAYRILPVSTAGYQTVAVSVLIKGA